MITDPKKTPEVIYVQEDFGKKVYRINQDENLPGMVKYIRCDIASAALPKGKINLFWELLARLGFWIPCAKYMPPKLLWDWVLISHIDCMSGGLRVLPCIGEYSYTTWQWHTDSKEGTEYLRKYCIVTHWHKLPSVRIFKARKNGKV